MDKKPNQGSDLRAAPVTTKQWITPRRLTLIILMILSISVGIMAFLIDPIYIIAVLIAIISGLLIFRHPYFGLLLYYVTFVIRPAAFVPQLAPLHPERIIGGLLLVSILIHKNLKGERILLLGEKMNWLFGFFILAMALSVPFSYWPSATVWTIIDFLKICIFYFLVTNVITTPERLKGFIWIYIIAAGYIAISSTIAYFSGTLAVAQGIQRAEGLAGADPNTLAVTLVLAIPFMIFSLSWIRNRWLKLVPLFCAGLAVLTVALTGSRSGILGLLAVFFFIWLTSNRKLALALAFLTLLVASWFALPQQYQQRYASIASSEYDPSTEGRFDAWNAGLRMFYARPFFGVGAGTFHVAFASGHFSDRISWLKAHSMYIQVIAEIGLIGLVAFAMLVYYMLRQNFRLRKLLLKKFKRRSWLSYISYSITCSVGALFVTSIFGHSLFRLHWYWACALTVVMWRLVDNQLNEGNNAEDEQQTARGRALPRRS